MEPLTLLQASLFVAVGLAVLAGGGELLVRGAIHASRLLRVSPVVVGLTVVAFATSLPELAVSLLAALRGSPDVAVGNVVGSNMFNVAVIVGLSALLFAPLYFRSVKIRFDVGVMIGVALAMVALGWNGTVGRAEGIVFVGLLAGFLWFRVRGAREPDAGQLEPLAQAAVEVHARKSRGVAVSIVQIFVGAGLLSLGAEALVRGAIFIARDQGISERVIAITLVSAGTGLPELATAIVAGLRGHTAVAIGNVVGSNIFNVLGILGVVALVHPLPAHPRLMHDDAIWMLGVSLFVLLPVLKPGRRMSRPEGLVVVLVYAAYLVRLLRT